MRFELHCHSTCSDGELPASEMGEMASQDGVDVFCLTDHDTSAGHKETVHATGVQVLRGVEVSCQYADRSVHLLVYEPATGCDWRPLEIELEGISMARRERLREIGRRLAKRAINIDTEAILEAAGSRTVGRPDIARALVAVGAVKDMNDAFRYFLFDRGPLDVPSARISLADAIRLATEIGARTSLAHPNVYGIKRVEQIASEFAGRGLGGLEAHYGPYKKRERRGWLELAAHHGLVATGGSDFHNVGDCQHLGVDLETEATRALLEFLDLS